MKKLKLTVLLLLLACLLLGCMGDGADQTDPAEVPSSETVMDTEPETVPLEGVNLHAFRAASERPGIAVFNHRRAAFISTEFVQGDFTRKQSRVQVYDLHTDAMEREIVLPGTYVPVFNCSAPEHIALFHQDENRVVVFNGLLEEVMSFPTEVSGGILAENMEYYYYSLGSSLYCLNTAQGSVEKITTDPLILVEQLKGYDPQENVALVCAYENLYTTDLCMAAIDLDDGEITLLYENMTGGSLGDSGVFLEQLYLEERYADLCYGDWTDSHLQKLAAFLYNDLDYNMWHVSGTDYVCKITYDPAQKVSVVDCQLFRLGETAQVCSIQEELGGLKFNDIIALPDGNLLGLAVNRRGFQTCLICPELLEFVPAELVPEQGNVLVDTALLGQCVPAEVPEEMASLREWADRLEGEYGVTILLSNQCAVPASACDMPITTTDQAGLPNEVETIHSAMEDLEGILEKYPKDFFLQFRNEGGERGLLILLVEDISDDLNSDLVEVIGVSYGMGQWYPVAIDITSGEVSQTYFHEIWHATENRIVDMNEGALDMVGWEAINPLDFHYLGLTDDSYLQETKYTYFWGNPADGVYFVDPYAKTKPQEDRARLMEYVMYSDEIGGELMKSEPMRQKLQILCDAIRKVFDTSSWEYVHWERFF